MSIACNLQSSCFLISQIKLNNSRKCGRISVHHPVKISLSCGNKYIRLSSSPACSMACSTSTGKFGIHGGKYVPELLMTSLRDLEDEFYKALNDEKFKEELGTALREYVGRETPLYYAERLTNYYKNEDGRGPEIYLKREDLTHGGSHKINNALAQAMLAKRIGRTSIITSTGAGRHGVATAAACAKLGLQCTVFMGRLDIERQPTNVDLMKVLGAQVNSVEGSFKDACSEAVRGWVANFSTSYHLPASVVGPHPCPTIAREFQSVIGKEVRKQAMEKWGGKPDVLVACVGGGSNAIGLFHEFVQDEGVRLLGVEAAGCGLESGKHSATLAKGEVGVYHGAMSYLLQDDEGQIVGPYSIGVGLEYPGVGPELSYLKDTQRAEFYAVKDEEALHAYRRLCKLEGIFPALEASHALAYLDKLCPTLPHGTKVVVNCSGRGDKDATTVLQLNQLLTCTALMNENQSSSSSNHTNKQHFSTDASNSKDLLIRNFIQSDQDQNVAC